MGRTHSATRPEPKVKQGAPKRLCLCGCGKRVSQYNREQIIWAHRRRPHVQFVGGRFVVMSNESE